MVTLITIINFAESLFKEAIAILNTEQFVLVATTISILLKSYLLTKLLSHHWSWRAVRRHWFLLVLFLISSIIVDSAWIVSTLHHLFFPTSILAYQIRTFWVRTSWGFASIHYLALSLFIESFVAKTTTLSLRQKIHSIICLSFLLFSVALAVSDIHCTRAVDRPSIELIIRSIEIYYLLFILMLPSFLLVIYRLRTAIFPKILTQQLNIFTRTLVIPIWISDVLHLCPAHLSSTWVTNSYFAASACTLLIAYAVFYCSRTLIKLRFLNFNNHVQIPSQINFIDKFKEVLQQLSYATSIHELRHVTQTFFKDSLDIPLTKTSLHERKGNIAENMAYSSDYKVATLVENFMETTATHVIDYITRAKVLIYDEIVFDYFYSSGATEQTIITFMDTIHADIFLPVYEKQSLVAYIIVERGARDNKLYGASERDQMIIFANYLGNIINLLHSKDLKNLVQQEKELREELYYKHQEVNQYKESIRSFLKSSQQKDIGIIFYKNRHFTMANKAAKDLLEINPNIQEGHPLTKTLKHIAQASYDYKTPQTCLTHGKCGEKLVIAGVPSIEGNSIIITVYHPEVLDIIKNQIDHLKDPTGWDYLLYLETTKSGHLINQLIPGNGETLLNFKIDLLKIALSKKAILLDLPEADLLPTVEILHYTSLRDKLHILDLQGPCKAHETAIKLFGINPLFGITHQEKPLLEQLNGIGTLFIKNVHFLSSETQEYLAEFIRYGMYRTFKSEHKTTSDVRILCSTAHDLQHLVHIGAFSPTLYEELKKTTLHMPSLTTLSDEELNQLTDKIAEQTVKTKDFKNLLELSEKEKKKIKSAIPVSLQDFKATVQEALLQKSKQNNIYHEVQFDAAYNVSDPQLAQAARLGKHALKDPKIMALLWDKFKSQSKIASFLGVNRSSVNRRCKDYNLE